MQEKLFAARLVPGRVLEFGLLLFGAFFRESAAQTVPLGDLKIDSKSTFEPKMSPGGSKTEFCSDFEKTLKKYGKWIEQSLILKCLQRLDPHFCCSRLVREHDSRFSEFSNKWKIRCQDGSQNPGKLIQNQTSGA